MMCLLDLRCSVVASMAAVLSTAINFCGDVEPFAFLRNCQLLTKNCAL